MSARWIIAIALELVFCCVAHAQTPITTPRYARRFPALFMESPVSRRELNARSQARTSGRFSSGRQPWEDVSAAKLRRGDLVLWGNQDPRHAGVVLGTDDRHQPGKILVTSFRPIDRILATTAHDPMEEMPAIQSKEAQPTKRPPQPTKKTRSKR